MGGWLTEVYAIQQSLRILIYFLGFQFQKYKVSSLENVAFRK